MSPRYFLPTVFFTLLVTTLACTSSSSTSQPPKDADDAADTLVPPKCDGQACARDQPGDSTDAGDAADMLVPPKCDGQACEHDQPGDSADAGDVADALVPPRCDGRTCDPDPPGDGVDSNGDGIDGELDDTIFLAEDGSDTSMGTMPHRPVSTLQMALQRARETNRRTILVEVGLYDTTINVDGGTPSPTVIDRTVRIYGRYARATGTSRWLTRNPMEESLVIGPTAGLTIDSAPDVLLDGLTFEGQPVGSNPSAYGIIVRDAPGLRVVDSILRAQPGRHGANGMPGMPGRDGQHGMDGQSNGVGGRGGAGCGTYPNHGGNGGTSAREGAAAIPATPGTTWEGRRGPGAGENGDAMYPVASAGVDGTEGPDGVNGRNGDLGLWTREGFFPQDGRPGQPGVPGSGGGGGGAGFTAGGAVGGSGGGGGGGACGGGGGGGGGSGGASVGLYLVGNTTSVTLFRCRVFASNGGNGGAGGEGAGGFSVGLPPQGGRGGEPGPPGRSGSVMGYRGARGGRGGNGGWGGRGGAGLGGPSVGIMRIAGATVNLSATRVVVGMAGMHGAPTILVPQLAEALASRDMASPSPSDAGVMGDAALDAAGDVRTDVFAE